MTVVLEGFKEIIDKSNSEELLLNYFSAIVDKSEKIDELRTFILDLAIEGKLVKQNLEDETVDSLLKKIKEEKDILGIKHSISSESINILGWKKVKLKDLGITQTGTTPSTKKTEFFGGEIPFIKPADISKNGMNYKNESLTQLGVENGRLIKKNSVMMVCIGGSIGKCYFVDRDCSCNQQINAITPLGGIQSEFLNYWLSSRYFSQELMKYATGSATPIINKTKWENINIYLPPLDEQKRILEKIKLLMNFCNKLENALEQEQKYKRMSAKSVFNSTALVSNNEELEKTLKFIIENFKELSLGNNAIKELRNCILQLAVQGMLAKQNRNDEPIDSLLKKIKDEKEVLLKQIKLKKAKTLEEVTEEEKSFKIPKSWKWVRLDEITSYIQRGKSPKYSEVKGIPVVSQKCIQWSGFEIGRAKFIDPNTLEKYSEERFLENGDLLWNSTGAGTLGRINIYLESKKYDTVVADSHVTVIRPIKKYIDSEYLYIWLAGPRVQSEIEEKSSGSTKQIELSTGTVRSYAVPLPPIEEQKRIVKRVKILLEVCEILEAKIKKQEKLKEKLLKALIK